MQEVRHRIPADGRSDTEEPNRVLSWAVRIRLPRSGELTYVGQSKLPVYLITDICRLQISHWRGIREVLESNGCEVLITRVAATASIADRAATLEALISEKYPGRQVNLVGHSMGGLDCRYLISQIQPKTFQPITLTTISTPHRGSPFADFLIDNVIGRKLATSHFSSAYAQASGYHHCYPYWRL